MNCAEFIIAAFGGEGSNVSLFLQSNRRLFFDAWQRLLLEAAFAAYRLVEAWAILSQEQKGNEPKQTSWIGVARVSGIRVMLSRSDQDRFVE